MVRHGDLLLRPIPEPKKVLAAAEVAAFTLATSEATHTLTGRIEPATVEVSEGTAIPVVHVLEPSSLIHEEHPADSRTRLVRNRAPARLKSRANSRAAVCALIGVVEHRQTRSPGGSRITRRKQLHALPVEGPSQGTSPKRDLT